jgi:hypothetical protein
MAVQKLSVALDETVAAAARAAASREGLSLSAWLSRAAEQVLRIEAGLLAVSEWEADHGPISAGEREAADRLLDAIADRRRRSA